VGTHPPLHALTHARTYTHLNKPLIPITTWNITSAELLPPRNVFVLSVKRSEQSSRMLPTDISYQVSSLNGKMINSLSLDHLVSVGAMYNIQKSFYQLPNKVRAYN